MNVFDLIIKDNTQVELAKIVLSCENKETVNQLLKEYKHQEKLLEYGLPVNHKVLLYGSSGCGKTTLAKAIAQDLQKSILILNLSTIINARIGETSQNIKQIFEKAARDKAILFLDEFDQIGKDRISDEKDVGEMRRLVNTVIQQIDYLPEAVLLIVATNHIEIIDDALVRRFQLRLRFDLPTRKQLDAYYEDLLARFPEKWHGIDRKYEISYAEAKDYLLTGLKKQLIAELEV